MKITADNAESLSVSWENHTGYDSIPTIKRVYPRSESGAFQCVWPWCRFTRRDPFAMWKHVHSAHQETTSLPPENWEPCECCAP